MKNCSVLFARFRERVQVRRTGVDYLTLMESLFSEMTDTHTISLGNWKEYQGIPVLDKKFTYNVYSFLINLSPQDVIIPFGIMLPQGLMLKHNDGSVVYNLSPKVLRRPECFVPVSSRLDLFTKGSMLPLPEPSNM